MPRSRRQQPFGVPVDPLHRLPVIVVQYDETGGEKDPARGIRWDIATAIGVNEYGSDAAKLHDAVTFCQEGIQKMTGRTLAVESSSDLSEGIVFTRFAGATPDIRDDPDVRAALANGGIDRYANEAFFIRSEKQRLLLVANTFDGLLAASEELLASVDYEVLGMGPNWIYVPNYSKVLTFNLERVGRPGYYVRSVWATSGQHRGIGTVHPKWLDGRSLDEGDETVDHSYRRWRVGTRTAGRSIPPRGPGHALSRYHWDVAEHIRETGEVAGFLAPTRLAPARLGPEAEPPTTPDEARLLWIDSAHRTASRPKVYLWDSDNWREQTKTRFAKTVLDLSVPAVRNVVFKDMKQKAERHFVADPHGVFVMPIEKEDGGATDADFIAHTRHPRWYPDYLDANGLRFEEPYALHGHNGIDQPTESWDPDSQTDAMYGFGRWILHEFDRWIDSLPEGAQVTASGQPKKDQVQVTFNSYNYHDVLPSFNLDRRMRPSVAGFPKHRGWGKWRRFRTQLDIVAALQRLLPKQPLEVYQIMSTAKAADWGMRGLPVNKDLSPEAIASDLRRSHEAGVDALTMESDFNFGKFGLGYYLIAKMLWNPWMTTDELTEIRDRWLQRAFGSAWRTMREYYEFMLVGNYPVNSTSSWGHAVSLIDQADELLDPDDEREERRRLDDLKQYWYNYYLHNTGRMTPADPQTRELAWKGQMSYMNAMHVLMGRLYPGQDPVTVAGGLADGPAHYGAAETAAWWKQVRAHWPEVRVARFEDAVLANNRPAHSIDLNDLVLPEELAQLADRVPEDRRQPYLQYNSWSQDVAFLTVAPSAGSPIGFQLWWPKKEDVRFPHRYAGEKDVAYRVERWNGHSWEVVRSTNAATAKMPGVRDDSPEHPRLRDGYHLVTVSMTAPSAGTYRFHVGRGGNEARLAPPTYHIEAGRSEGRSAQAYFGLGPVGPPQRPAYFYIPKRTASLDLDAWDNLPRRLYQGLHSPDADRGAEVAGFETYHIGVRDGEGGTVAWIAGKTPGFFYSASWLRFPYLHSVPRLWAKSPEQLLVPRAIADADGLLE